MPLSEDDFGVIRPAWRHRLRGQGLCQPRPQIGSAIWDTVPEKEPVLRQYDQVRGNLDSAVYPTEDLSARRLKRVVPPPKSSNDRGEGIKKINMVPAKQRGIYDASKRCFSWARSQPTGYENPVSFEEEPIPGMRPSHPVAANGPVGTEHRRSFPEKQHCPTAIPPPALCKPPSGNEWGGWAVGGAPGRGPMQQPWDSLLGSGQDAEERFCDARTKRFPEMKYQDTSHHIRWHLDAKEHIDPINAKRIHRNAPTVATASSPAGQRLAFQRASGRPSRMPVEGAALDWYDKVRVRELQEAGPWSAR